MQPRQPVAVFVIDMALGGAVERSAVNRTDQEQPMSGVAELPRSFVPCDYIDRVGNAAAPLVHIYGDFSDYIQSRR